jgi:hypothetical protein
MVLERHVMKRVLFLLSTTVLLPPAVRAQSTEADIQRALLAAPAAMRAAATVLELRPDGTTAGLRQGTNGLICWDNRGRPGFTDLVDVQCTAEGNRTRLEQNHAFQSAGGTEAEIQARFDRADADGTRATSVFGSIYYHVIGSSLDDYRTHTTVAVPYATKESIGLPTARGPALLWLMEAGTSSAHLMVSGM